MMSGQSLNIFPTKKYQNYKMNFNSEIKSMLIIEEVDYSFYELHCLYLLINEQICDISDLR